MCAAPSDPSLSLTTTPPPQTSSGPALLLTANAASTAAQGYFVFRHPRTTCNTASIVNVLQTATVLRAWCLAMTVAVLTCGVDRDTDSPVKATLTWVWLGGAGAVVAGGAVYYFRAKRAWEDSDGVGETEMSGRKGGAAQGVRA